MKYTIGVHNNLEEIRIDNNYSRSELADCAGTTEETIEQIELGAFVPPLMLCMVISKILDVYVEDIWELKKVCFS